MELTTTVLLLLCLLGPAPAGTRGTEAPIFQAADSVQIGAGVKDLLIALADSSDTLCKVIQIHPEVGDTFYSLAVRDRLPWHVLYRLPVALGRVVHRGPRTLIFTPPLLDRPSPACLGLAATALRRWVTKDSIQLFVEILNRGSGGLFHAFTVGAIGTRVRGVWRFIITGEGD